MYVLTGVDCIWIVSYWNSRARFVPKNIPTYLSNFQLTTIHPVILVGKNFLLLTTDQTRLVPLHMRLVLLAFLWSFYQKSWRLSEKIINAINLIIIRIFLKKSYHYRDFIFEILNNNQKSNRRKIIARNRNRPENLEPIHHWYTRF
jgi:hypothetical protein